MGGGGVKSTPSDGSNLMAYQATKIRCYRDFEEQWAQYDRVYSAITTYPWWGKIDATLL